MSDPAASDASGAEDAADRSGGDHHGGAAAEQPGGQPAPERTAIDELGAYIRDQREAARLSLRKLAKLAGVSNPYLSQIERGLRKPSAEILQAIAKALEISSETLYVKAGILDEREAPQEVEQAIAADPHLTDAQRQALTEMYRSFRRLAELQPAGPGRRRGLFDAVTTGGVDDAAVRAATPPEEADGGV